MKKLIFPILVAIAFAATVAVPGCTKEAPASPEKTSRQIGGVYDKELTPPQPPIDRP